MTKYIAAIGTFIAAVFAALFYREKAGREKEKRVATEAARETERKATDALTHGLTREQQEVERAKSDSAGGRRDHFER